MQNDFPLEQFGTKAEIAKVVGCHFRTVENWSNQGAIKKTDAGFPLIETLVWQIQALKKDLEISRKKASDDPLYEANVRLKNAEAEIKELDLLQRKGILVETEKIQQEWQNLIINARAKLLGLPTKLAYELASLEDPVKVEIVLQKAIDKILIELGNGS